MEQWHLSVQRSCQPFAALTETVSHFSIYGLFILQVNGTCVYMYTVHVSATVHIYFMYMLGVLCCFALFVCLTLLASFFFLLISH